VVRVESPPVEEEQGLLLRLQRAGDLLDEPTGQGRHLPVRVALALHVHDLDARHFPLLDASRQAEIAELLLPRVVETLKTRRGRSQNDGGAPLLGQHDSQVPGVVGHPFVLFVGGVVLLVYDDQAQVPDGREDGRPGAHDDLRLAPGDPAPLVVAQRRPDPAVQDGDLLRGKPAFQPAHKLGRQRDLRDEVQDSAAPADCFGDGVDVHLRLSAARDAVQQVRGKGARGDPFQDRLEGSLLLRGQHRGSAGPPDRGSRFETSQGFPVADGDESFLFQGPEEGERPADLREVGHPRPSPQAFKCPEGLPLAFREPGRSRRGLRPQDVLFRLFPHGGLSEALLEPDEPPGFQFPQLRQKSLPPQFLLEAAQGHPRRVPSQRPQDVPLEGLEIVGLPEPDGPQQALDVDAARENLADRPAERGEVVLGGPPVEPQVLLVKEGLAVEDAEDLPDVLTVRRAADGDNGPRQRPLPEGDEHPLAHGDLAARFHRHGIGEGAVRGDVDGDIDKHDGLRSCCPYGRGEPFCKAHESVFA